MEMAGNFRLARFLAREQDMRLLSAKALEILGRDNFTDTVPRFLKSSYCVLSDEAVTETERLTVRLLKSCRDRIRMATEIANLLETDDAEELETRLPLKEDARARAERLNDCLKKLQGPNDLSFPAEPIPHLHE